MVAPQLAHSLDVIFSKYYQIVWKKIRIEKSKFWKNVGRNQLRFWWDRKLF
jgi:hypothetical protein